MRLRPRRLGTAARTDGSAPATAARPSRIRRAEEGAVPGDRLLGRGRGGGPAAGGARPDAARRRARAGGPVPGGRTGPRARGPGARCGRTGTLTVRPSRPPGPDRAPDRAVRRARHRRGRTPAALSALAVRADRGGHRRRRRRRGVARVAPGWRPGDTPVSPRCLSSPIGGTRHTPRAPRPGEPRPAQHARPVWTVHAPSTHCPRPARRHRTETWWTFDPLALSPTS